MKRLKNKPRLYVILFTVLFVAAVTAPFWLWQIKGSKKLNVFIIDKTVPDQSYREHNGLVWVLNNEKYKTDDGEAYSAKKHYSGFKPGEGGKFSTIGLPENLERQDVIYLADQYGVYEEEFSGGNKLGKRSEMLYGGLQPEELDQIETALHTGKGKTFIAEFNTFGSPATPEVRSRISNILNADWTGWIGRYFPDMTSEEVPVWAREQYEKQTGKWEFSGPGFVFVNQEDYVVVAPANELTGKGAKFSYTNAGEKRFGQKLDTAYQYWFDIIEARDKSEILASYRLPLKEKAKERLAGFGIPADFPAVVSHENARFTSYYFAGDFADEGEVPSIYQTKGLAEWRQFLGAENSFYWEAYVPMMKKLLKNGLHKGVDQQKVQLAENGGIKTNSKTGDDYIQVMRNGKWENLLIKGVNMGIGKPGHFPGEAAITKDEYIRWFKAIGAMNTNALRIYTLHPPVFYEALKEYNETAKKPLYLFHGAWVNEDELVKGKDAYLSTEDFKTELTYLVDIIHGNAELPERKGHASGSYKTDISKYVLGIIAGIEWDPQMTVSTNEKHKGMKQYEGTYFRTDGASPFEIWLAQMIDYTAKYETDKYGWQHTMSFTNWVTTDLLKHPSEPSKEEDVVTVNPNHILPKEDFQAGVFASYHIYPYYPDFLNLDEKYLKYKDADGNPNNYAGYLNDLIKEHSMPVVVAEFGVPSSRGIAHSNPFGMGQGKHSEQEQGDINTTLFKSIVDEGYAGGMVFSWQDEWFKKTWNTMDLDNPSRRPFWDNQQTNEEHFGILGFDPGEKGTTIYPDGKIDDWVKLGSKPAYQSKEGSIKEAHFAADAGYLHFLLKLNEPANLEKMPISLLLDTVPGQGQKEIKNLGEGRFKSGFGTDFIINLGGEKNSRVLVDSYYDPFYYYYGYMLKMIAEKPYAQDKVNGVFHPVKLALNKKRVHPITKEVLPFEDIETGVLTYGTGNPKDKNFNSLTDISLSKDKKVIEGRIAWQLINIKDPSQHEAMGDLWKGGPKKSVFIDGIRIAVTQAENGEIKELFPGGGNEPYVFTWKKWQEPYYHERLKESYYIMKKAYETIGIEGERK
ncbi:hypothetical protein [Bacillus sp. B-jedd]|uniref:hypothetical protein n=1 Tax=Bacillus sp. B-jedd TaxID=1476857 RepID=UPI000515646B|nr:hypothetical protein [Bacillus sp. B-jedd]CEG29750.1 glycosyl transferase family protein [Bacillus sp. B-jedd]